MVLTAKTENHVNKLDVADGMGLIVRTAGHQRITEIRRDFTYSPVYGICARKPSVPPQRWFMKKAISFVAAFILFESLTSGD